MPTLHWIGKEKVINHHLDVPYKVLEHTYHFDNGIQTLPTPPESSGQETIDDSNNKITTSHPSPRERGRGEASKIIHGDNLEALKSLLPEYEGKIKCIYIDPPYNTGNEGWVYNDNVTDPKIKKWLGQVVGKESEDLSRHDKWLCMMYPRLKLLHKLLADEGAIFISIDDNEQANLKLICDEIFGVSNFVSNIIWRSADSSNNDAKQFSTDYNHTMLYSKIFEWQPNKLERTDDNNGHYKNPDNDINGPWFMGNLSSPNPRPNLTFDIISPNGTSIKPPKNGWRWKKERIDEMIERKEIIFSEDQKRIIKKTYLKDQSGIVPSNIWWDIDETGHNRNAKYELMKVFSELKTSDVFKTPKPTKFIDKILKICSDKDSIILDSFAGSGTTAHAVLNLNKQDGGNRKFILIEMESYAETITAERVKRVINGYGDKEGTGGSFDFYTLGEPMFDGEGLLNEKVGVEKIRQYVYYTETKQSLNRDLADSSDLAEGKKDHLSFMGKHNDTAYYFHYEPEQVTTLNHDFLASMKTKAEQYVIYADNCVLTKDFMTRHHLIFKKIPRDITRF